MGNTKNKIPKIIHQIWIGERPIPKKALRFQDKIKTQNPEFDYILWDNDLIKKNSLGNNKAYSLSNNYGYRSDILRYEIIYKFGGIYLDVDFEPLRPLRPLLKYESFISYYASFAQNAVIGGTPKNLFWGFVLNQLPGWANHMKGKASNVVDTTGPGFLNIMIEKYRSIFEKEPITILPTNFFYPDLKNLKYTSDESYGIHWFWGTWL